MILFGFSILQHIYGILAQPPIHYIWPFLNIRRCLSVVCSPPSLPHTCLLLQGRSAPRATRCRATATTTPACTAAPAPRAGTDTSATARKPPSRAPPVETVSHSLKLMNTQVQPQQLADLRLVASKVGGSGVRLSKFICPACQLQIQPTGWHNVSQIRQQKTEVPTAEPPLPSTYS